MCEIKDFDWLCVDLEHSPNGRLDLQLAVSIIQGKGKRAFARVNENRHAEIKFALDSGIDGIIIPMVNSYDDALLAIENCLYPPKGRRGVGLARAQKYGFAFEDHLRHNLEKLEIIVQVEHYKAVEHIERILQVDEIKGIFIGPYDLSGSMGVPGQFEHPDVVRAIERVTRETTKSGKLLGAHIIPPDHNKVIQYRNAGYNFLAFSIDTFFLGQKIRDEFMHFHKKLVEV